MEHIGLKDYIGSPNIEYLQRMYGDDGIQKSVGVDINENSVDAMVNQINKSFNTNVIDEGEAEAAVTFLDDFLEKGAGGEKYYKRTGTPGNYKYYYTKEQYEKEGGGKGEGEKKDGKSGGDSIAGSGDNKTKKDNLPEKLSEAKSGLMARAWLENKYGKGGFRNMTESEHSTLVDIERKDKVGFSDYKSKD